MISLVTGIKCNMLLLVFNVIQLLRTMIACSSKIIVLLVMNMMYDMSHWQSYYGHV